MPGANILICAPANDACDMIASKLKLHCDKTELIRAHTETRNWSSVPEEIRCYSNYTEKGYKKLTGKDLMQYRIVVTTLVFSGNFARGDYHPDFLFIDEAGQASEPEGNIAIALLSSNKQLILAGDPKQLGPVCSSRKAEGLGLGISLLERLMKNDLYKSKNPHFITMLRNNYRSHHAILQLPNELFYNNELLAVRPAIDPISRIKVHSRIQRLRYKTKANSDLYNGSPIEFLNVSSKEQREGYSPSYYNLKEADMVKEYVMALVNLKTINISVELSDIGIITPYARQVSHIKNKLRGENFHDIEVGTTESFQGREKRIIIISTVRAQDSLLLYDKMYNLGFVKHEKRLNVILTRAMSKLIIIGCANVLAYDQNWMRCIEKCEFDNSYFGPKYVRRTNEVKEKVFANFQKVNLQDSQYQPQNN